ncbi:MAG TPA: hypothetical protein PKD64_11225 [Pirellulaceae bacterium]|nr:hypothetical protein [Pirellulaceae bacterium]HMO92755.1 hypothetical protein [Pirellulaceae bacterium]HMP71491.1 hypothetical protein [Pirellulaceae bacterium]
MIDRTLLATIVASSSLGCILCGRETKQVGVFIPNCGVDYAVPQGWRFVYRICEDHFADWPEVTTRVERKIWKHQRGIAARFCGWLDESVKSR